MTEAAPIYNTLQFRRATSAEWTARNPVLDDGEPGVESDTFRVKIGNAYLPWQDLPYVAGSAETGTTLLALLSPTAVTYPALTGQAAVTVGALTTSVPAGSFVTDPAAPATVHGGLFVAAGSAWRNRINDPHPVEPSPVLELDVVTGAASASVVSVVLTNPAAVTIGARAWIDGVAGAFTTVAVTAGGLAYLPITVPAGQQRRIRVEAQNARYRGVLATAGQVAVSPAVDPLPRVAVFGDSWVEGALGVEEQRLWPNVLGRLLGVPSVGRMGQGGSGYVAEVPAWSAKPYTDATRLARLVEYAPALVVIQGSQNDDGASPAAVGVAAAQVYETISDALPHTRLVVVGPPRLNTTPSAARLANRDAVKAAATAAGNVLGFVDQMGPAGAWITGTGRAGATTGDGNADVVLGSDAAHMTADGHAYFARRVYAETVRLLRSAA